MLASLRACASALGAMGLVLAAGCREAARYQPAAPSQRPAAGPARPFRVEDFGARADDAGFNSAPAIQRAIDAAMASGPGAEVVLGPGRYMVCNPPGRDTAVRLDGADGLVFRGAGPRTELVSTTISCGLIRMIRCRNTFVRDLAIDYSPPLIAVGTVCRVTGTGPPSGRRRTDDEPGTFDAEFDPDYAIPGDDGFPGDCSDIGYLFDARDRHLKAGAPDFFYAVWRPLGENLWRIRVRWPPMDFVSLGDRVVLRRGGGDGFWIHESRDCGVERVTIHACPSVAFSVTGNEGLTLDAVAVRFRKGAKRLVTSNADGMHCSGNRGPLRIQNCFLEGMLDDAININSHNARILSVRSPQEVEVDQKSGVKPGHRLQVVDQGTGTIRQEVSAAAVGMEAGRAVVTLDRPVAGIRGSDGKTDGDYLYNLTLAAPDYVIRNNHFRPSRRFAMLLHSGPGLVENNLVEGVTGHALVLGNDPHWGEGPLGRDVVIRGNVIRGVGYCRGYGSNPAGGAIQVVTYTTDGRPATGRPQRNITIEGNRFEDIPGVAIYIGSADGVRLIGNVITARAGAPTHVKAGAIVLENSRDVRVENCRVDDPRPDTTSAVEIRRTVAPGAEGVIVSELQARLAEGAKPVDDQR